MASLKEKSPVEDKINSGECFVIMPFSDPDGYVKGHFKHVYNDLIRPAIIKSGFEPFRADENMGANLIHLEILKKLLECPMALCDLSSRNPNVLFELGIRQAFDKPVVLVQEEGTANIFDISGINTIPYRGDLIYHEVLDDQEKISSAIDQTVNSLKNGYSINSIIRLLGIGEAAKVPVIKAAKENPMFQYILSELTIIKNELNRSKQNNEIFSARKSIEEISNYSITKCIDKFHRLEESVNEIINNNEFRPSLISELRSGMDECFDIMYKGHYSDLGEIHNQYFALNKRYAVYLKTHYEELTDDLKQAVDSTIKLK